MPTERKEILRRISTPCFSEAASVHPHLEEDLLLKVNLQQNRVNQLNKRNLQKLKRLNLLQMFHLLHRNRLSPVMLLLLNLLPKKQKTY
jgi:hypothetical protein